MVFVDVVRSRPVRSEEKTDPAYEKRRFDFVSDSAIADNGTQCCTIMQLLARQLATVLSNVQEWHHRL